MITLYCLDEVWRRGIAERLTRLGAEIHVTADWKDAERSSVGAESTIAVIEWLEEDWTFPLVCGFKARLPFHPVLLVT